MKNISDKNKTGDTKNAQSALADINAQIVALNQQRVGLAQPLKERYAEMRSELTGLETEIRSLDGEWKPEPMKPKAEVRIAEVLTKGPLTADEIMKELAGAYTNWKVKTVLKKRSTGAKAVFTLTDGKYSLKAV